MSIVEFSRWIISLHSGLSSGRLEIIRSISWAKVRPISGRIFSQGARDVCEVCLLAVAPVRRVSNCVLKGVLEAQNFIEDEACRVDVDLYRFHFESPAFGTLVADVLNAFESVRSGGFINQFCNAKIADFQSGTMAKYIVRFQIAMYQDVIYSLASKSDLEH